MTRCESIFALPRIDAMYLISSERRDEVLSWTYPSAQCLLLPEAGEE